MHVDDFIDGQYNRHHYARWVLQHFRLSAALRIDFNRFMTDHKLFCTYEGVRYRCTGASRLGDVWLTTDFAEDTRYKLRVDVAECSDWGAAP